jgi:GAF domain-containing protein
MLHDVATIWTETYEVLRVANAMREQLTPVLEQLVRHDPGFRARYRRSMLISIVDSAMRIAHADMANIQLFDPASGRLRIEAQRGFHEPFLEFFNAVSEGHAACGTALKCRTQVVVEDVAANPIFQSTPSLEVVLDAGVRAVQSTPLIGRSGAVLGILSTHWRTPGPLRSPQLRMLHSFSCHASSWIEQRMLLL